MFELLITKLFGRGLKFYIMRRMNEKVIGIEILIWGRQYHLYLNKKCLFYTFDDEMWYPQGDLNPCLMAENHVSWASRRWGHEQADTWSLLLFDSVSIRTLSKLH